MEQKAQKLYPYASLENIDLEQRLEKKLNDVKCFDNSINTEKKRLHTSKKKHEPKKKYKK